MTQGYLHHIDTMKRTTLTCRGCGKLINPACPRFGHAACVEQRKNNEVLPVSVTIDDLEEMESR